MDKQRIFNAIIVDTNAFDGKGNDFCGYHSKLLPSFFDTIRRLNIQLISHPILKEETIKHIKTGDWMNKPENAIKSITKYKTYLEIAKVSYDDIIKKLEGLDLCKNTIDAFKKEMSSTLMLPYPDPEKVFKKYFSNEPPFSESGAKKSEFPDAFVIEAIKQYLIDNPTISVLIVVKDKDWQNAFGDNKNILVTDNIDTALQLLNKHEEKLEKFILELNTEIKDFIENNAISDIWFEINEYECTEDIDSEYVRLITIDEDYVPLQITDTEIVLQTKLQLEVDGSTVIFDYDNSIWDNEEREYIMTSFSVMEFRDAKCNVTCEIYIALDEKQHPSLKYVKLIEPFGVNLEIDEEKVEFTDLNFV